MNSPVPPPLRGFSKNRIEAPIDGIFAVALMLPVVDIKLPENLSYATNRELWTRLKSLERHFVIYVIRFVVIGIYWVAHHVQFHCVRYTDRRLISINMVFLLLISFLPFATDRVGDNENLVLPCLIYSVTLLAVSAVSYVHLRYLERHPYLASPEFSPLAAKLIRRRIALFAIVPGRSTSVAFYSPRVALYVYLLLAGAHFMPGRIDEHVIAPPPVAADPILDSDPNDSRTGQ